MLMQVDIILLRNVDKKGRNVGKNEMISQRFLNYGDNKGYCF